MQFASRSSHISSHTGESGIDLSNLMELSSSLEANSRSASQEIHRLQWNLKVPYSIRKNTILDTILSQLNPVHNK
jgi:hypothetical protein